MRKTSKNRKLLGARIKELRNKKKLTQAQLGDKINLDSTHISSIEVGNSFPSLAKLEIMAEVLDVELQDFFVFVSSKTKSELLDEIKELVEKSTDERDVRVAHKVIKDILT